MDALLTTLLEVLSAHQDLVSGKPETANLQEAKKRFYQALHDFIDYRIRVAFEQRRSRQSQEMIAVADSINTNIKSTASTIKSIAALNSAPPPPNADEAGRPDAIQKWMKVYQEWYETKRKSGVNIE